MTAETIRWISFDLDDTLFDNQPVIRKAFARLYDFLVDQHPLVARHYNLSDFIQAAHRCREAHPDIVDYNELRHLHIQSVLKQAGYDLFDTQAAYDVFINARQEVDLFSKVIPLLEHLQPNYGLVSISNGNAQPAKIGLGKYFQHHYNPTRLTVAKPNPEVYVKVCADLGIAPEQLLHIGDCLDNDYRTALAAGCQAIWLHGGQPRPDVAHQFADIGMLYDALREQPLSELLRSN